MSGSELAIGAGGLGSYSRAGRAMSRLSGDATLAIGQVQAAASVQMAQLDAVSAITTEALFDAALVSQVEQTLAQSVPHASGRLATIADLGAVAMAGIVANAASRIQR